MPQTAPRVVKRFQNRLNMIVGRFADAATAKARPTRNAMFCFWARMPRTIARMPITMVAMRATLTSSAPVAVALLDHVAVEVVGERRARRQREAGDHGEDRGEGDRADDRHEDRAADRVPAPPPRNCASSGAAAVAALVRRR